MARTGIDFHTGFQSHPIPGWLFYCPLTRGREGEDVGILNKSKPKHGRLHRRVGMTLTALVGAVSMAFAPAAMADMQGIDVSNWQCGIDIANTQADFVVVGTTWGTGQVYNNCSRVRRQHGRQPHDRPSAGIRQGIRPLPLRHGRQPGGRGPVLLPEHVELLASRHRGARLGDGRQPRMGRLGLGTPFPE